MGWLMWPRAGHQLAARYSHRAGIAAADFLPGGFRLGFFAAGRGEFPRRAVAKCWVRWRPTGQLIRGRYFDWIG